MSINLQFYLLSIFFWLRIKSHLNEFNESSRAQGAKKKLIKEMEMSFANVVYHLVEFFFCSIPVKSRKIKWNWKNSPLKVILLKIANGSQFWRFSFFQSYYILNQMKSAADENILKRNVNQMFYSPNVVISCVEIHMRSKWVLSCVYICGSSKKYLYFSNILRLSRMNDIDHLRLFVFFFPRIGSKIKSISHDFLLFWSMHFNK